MPIHSCTLPSGKSGYKYGNSGKCYASREDALKQMRAMFYNGYTGGKVEDTMEEIVNFLTDEECKAFLGDNKIPMVRRLELSQAKLKKDKKDKIPKDKNGESQLPNVIAPLG